jgi:hypothetical protein
MVLHATPLHPDLIPPFAIVKTELCKVLFLATKGDESPMISGYARPHFDFTSPEVTKNLQLGKNSENNKKKGAVGLPR